MYYIQSLLFMLLAIASIKGSYGEEASTDPRIVGGSMANIEEYPYTVSLQIKKEKSDRTFRCGGSIANKNCVITAAHCFNDAESVTIRVGSTSYSKGGKEYVAKTFTKNPKYNRTTKDYDVGVIKPEKPIEINGKDSAQIKFPPKNCKLNMDTNLTVTGWGATDEDAVGNPDELRVVDLDYVPNDKCMKSYKYITPRKLCAAVPGGGKDACSGDSGGPLVYTGTKTQVGIVSSGLGCAREEYPGVYISVCNPDIQEWLKKEGCM